MQARAQARHTAEPHHAEFTSSMAASVMGAPGSNEL